MAKFYGVIGYAVTEETTCFFWILGIHPGTKQTKSC